MHESIVFCSTCTMLSYREFTFAISSPDEFLVLILVPDWRSAGAFIGFADGRGGRGAEARP